MVVTHNRAAGPIQGCTFETAKKTFVHIYQN